MEKNNKRVIRAWAMFDWANSAFALVITAAIFPAYFTSVTDSDLRFLGINMSNSTLYAWSLSAAFLLNAIFSPLLSGIADYGGKKKFFMKIFTIVGSLACLSLFFFRGMDTLWIGVLGFVVATFGFAGSIVFYNAFLPEIATEDRYDRVSAFGFSMGYVGSVLILLLNLFIIQNPAKFGFSEGADAVRFAFVLVGLWWFGFSQVTFRYLPADRSGSLEAGVLQKGYAEIRRVWGILSQDSHALRYLGAFFCFNAGVQTVIFLAAIFAEKVLNFETSDLILLIILLQFVGIIGALTFSRLSEKIGNKNTIIAMLSLWMVVCVGGYFVKGGTDFYLLASLVGLVMGGIQSIARSTYAKFFPENTPDTASFYSFYDVLDKISTVSGTFVFGLVEMLTGDIRLSLLSLSLFFALSILILLTVKIRRMPTL